MRINTSLNTLLVSLSILTACQSAQQDTRTNSETVINWISPGDDDQKSIQTLLLTAQPGETLYFDEGVFRFRDELSLEGIDGVTLKGRGMQKTIFSFKDQEAGAQGLIVKANQFTIEDMAIEDTKGDGIKVQDADGVVFRRFRMEWTVGPDSMNGSYGIYPVSSQNILMEECVARGASDAGIYVGQSENAIVRNNRVELNVAGIEVENTINAEVYGNTVQHNTAGILIFDLPNLPKKNGKNVVIYDNLIQSNNQPNFSPLGISVSIVPAGTGMLFMACQYIEAYNNRIIDNQTIGTAIVNLDQMKPNTDTLFDIYPSSIYLHDNYYERSNTAPDTSRSFGKALYAQFGDRPPMIIYDGVLNPELAVDGAYPDEHKICITNNENITFFNMSLQSDDISTHSCSLPAIEQVNLSGEQFAGLDH